MKVFVFILIFTLDDGSQVLPCSQNRLKTSRLLPVIVETMVMNLS